MSSAPKHPVKRATKPAPTAKAFDVFRPGKTTPPATSRPIIVGHKPLAQDTTLTDKPSQIVGVPDRHVLDAHDKVVIEPPVPAETQGAEPVAPTDTAQAKPDEAGDAPTTATVPDIPDPEALQDEQLTGSSTQAASPEAPPAPAAAEQAPPELPDEPDPLLTLPDEAAAPTAPAPASSVVEQPPAAPESIGSSAIAHTSYLEHLTTGATSSEPVELPATGDQIVISQHHAGMGWAKVLIVAVIILVLLAALADILLDAGLLTSAAIPHTHFITPR